MFSWSTFGLCWARVACAEWLFEPVAAVDSNRFSSNLQWTWFCVCGLEEQRTNSSSSMSPSSWESSRRREMCENPPNRTRNRPNSWPQTVQTTRQGCRTDWSELHTQPATRANDMINSPIEQKLQFSVCKTTRRFAGPSLLSCGLKPSFTKICIRISFCKTSLFVGNILRISAIRKKIAKLTTGKIFYEHIRHQYKHKLRDVFHFGTCMTMQLFWSFFNFLFFLPVPSRARESDAWRYRCSCMGVSWPQLQLWCDRKTGARCTMWHVSRKFTRRLHACKYIATTPVWTLPHY